MCIDGEQMSEEDLCTNFTPEMLRTILKRRGLPYDGEDTELLASRLAQHNQEMYFKYMDALENSHQPNVLRFELFRLPPEIRECIWELCHEPRILCINRQRILPSQPLAFWSYKNPPNPVTLSVCQESRAVALRNYKLMPHHKGTGLVYANFSGGDILYFDTRYWETMILLLGFRTEPRSYPDSSSTSKDHDAPWFDLVERVVICTDRVFFPSSQGPRPSSIKLMKRCIRTFRRLKHISVKKSPLDKLIWSQPGTVQQRQIEPSESDTNKRDARDAIAEAFVDVVGENELSTRKLLEVSTVAVSVVPKAPTKDWMVDLSTPTSLS
jgi:hypothetical protein